MIIFLTILGLLLISSLISTFLLFLVYRFVHGVEKSWIDLFDTKNGEG